MVFRVAIELGNAAMQTYDDVAKALRSVAEKIEGGVGNIAEAGSYDRSGTIMDENGNKVGTWKAGR